MEKNILRRLFGFLFDFPDQEKADTPSDGDPGDRWRPRLTAIEGGKGKGKWDGNERRKPCAVIGIPYSSDAADDTVEEKEESIMKHIAKYMFGFAAVAAAGFALGGCGGGGGGGGGGVTSAPVVSAGTVTKGSTIVNGIRFEDSAANIHPDDTNKVLTSNDVKNGMTVKVKGQRNDDGVTGTATEIEVENEVRGAITFKGADSLTVLGQTVFVDGGTVFANVANFTALVVGQAVEVHGQRDAAGAIRATRVELLVGPGVVDEVRGIVAGKDVPPGTFTIGGATFTYDAGTSIVDPAGGATFANGALVEIHLDAGTNRANRIEIEDDEDNEFDPAEGQEIEVEGYISGFAGPGDSAFLVGGQPVETNLSTRYEGGVIGDLADDVKVEAEGNFRTSDGTLVADKIKFKDSVRFEANVESKTSTSLNVLGRTVQVTSKTKNGSLLASLDNVTNPGVKIRAFLNQDNTFTATELQSTNQVQSDKHIVQGLVISFSSADNVVVLVKGTPTGFTVDTSGVSEANYQGDSVDDNSDASIGRTSFFNALIAGQTVVKAKGTWNGLTNTLSAVEVELE